MEDQASTARPMPVYDPARLVPEDLVELSARATPGQFFADGDRYDVYARPHDSSYGPDQRMVARCSVGEDAPVNAAFVAACVNFVRDLIAMPAGEEADVVRSMRIEDAFDRRLLSLDESDPSAQTELRSLRAGGHLPHWERRARREDQAARDLRPITDDLVAEMTVAFPKLSRDESATLLALHRHARRATDEVAGRIGMKEDGKGAWDVLRGLADRGFVANAMGKWRLTAAGDDLVARRDRTGVLRDAAGGKGL